MPTNGSELDMTGSNRLCKTIVNEAESKQQSCRKTNKEDEKEINEQTKMRVATGDTICRGCAETNGGTQLRVTSGDKICRRV